MAKLPVTQGATRRAYSRAARQARRRWLATKLMGQQPRRAEPREGRASREQLSTCFLAHGNYSSPGEGKCVCLPGAWLGWCSLVNLHLSPQLHLPWIGHGPLSPPSTCLVQLEKWLPENLELAWKMRLRNRLFARVLKRFLLCTNQGQKASGSLTPLTPPPHQAGKRKGERGVRKQTGKRRRQ